MSYADVARQNAGDPSEQPRPDPNLLTTEQDVSGGSLPDITRGVNVAPSDFKSNPHTVTSETTPAHQGDSDDEGSGNRPGSAKRRAAKDRARDTLHNAEEEGLYLWEQFKERVLRPSTAGGILGVINVGLLAFVGRELYTKPHLRSDTRTLGITAAAAVALLGAEGALADAYVKTPSGQKEKERTKKEGAALYRHSREVVLRPGVLGGLVGALNLSILGGVGYAAYLNWDKPRWDRRTVSAISASLLTLALGEGYLGEKYAEKEYPKRK
ncbi:hypothetical protein RSOLAG1IB_03573 [Rhizoctonia solani AG-1 IB]|uniref:Mitochondrial outer membrane protein OM14 C-terminal domain-containing protein n=1 Tax=Thanatephorus cucumeris (strain AG1-IB / isolate 7/3/14) TaxID=1108050 RepID=M5BIP0_THACB|nr:hypothetical protein BN14_00419 [Rhizoctonia solani AG-1 IB]CEL59640.1 hypothetical protein RSOLAG1IB_03573 [Rhizoctonia solani AG-1 IB]